MGGSALVADFESTVVLFFTDDDGSFLATLYRPRPRPRSNGAPRHVQDAAAQSSAALGSPDFRSHRRDLIVET